MKHAILIALLALGVPAAAQADCWVEYKAKQDSPLRLHYGIVRLPGVCPDMAAAAAQLRPRLSSGGWQLLNVVRLSQDAPGQKQRTNAGEYYLRY
ncbi:hypothetical protein [Salipiger aestuarii]|uniref:Uncharacterized protein n=1 Tax=Salipiger aestuarii TaxID=568098 RepID=A0A327Y4U6_9RHOB|nr:hypothetical protein [Salipiger aestuarii]EIE49724.1 hypothetical protein C357_16888 [Citreicella sp. 357]KAA8611127.1 hypothetical protein AL037_10710 [Salipiger aestuarii]KAB2541894.1 hypothetical protein AL035_10170 [Salipiger aestuarii]RAK15421.1 hypothetical protein ATI53_102364 [Salipiger aestuarii]